jgi:peptidoglycan-N-acetylglucosamine deacetylase
MKQSSVITLLLLLNICIFTSCEYKATTHGTAIIETKDTENKALLASVDGSNHEDEKNASWQLPHRPKYLVPLPVDGEELIIPSVFYPILGVSSKLTPLETRNIEKWRKEISLLSENNPEIIYTNSTTTKKVAALTFDDGPDGIITPKILDILKENNIKASFFFIGNSLNSYSQVVKRADKEGHLILNHSFSHPQLSTKSLSEVDKEVLNTENLIYSLIGKRPGIIRPPYGDVVQATTDELSKLNYKIIIWSIDTLDWSIMEKDGIVNNIISNIRPGDIILMHSNENKKATAEALPEIIKRLKEMNYALVTLDELLGVPAYK